MNFKLSQKMFLLLLLLLVFAADVYPRAGGGSSRSSSSSGFSSSSHSSSHSSSTTGGSSGGYDSYTTMQSVYEQQSAFYRNIVVAPTMIVVIVLIIFLFGGKKIFKSHKRTGGYFYKKAPHVSDKKQFSKKVKTAFHEIQTAWSNKDLSTVRMFLSDGLYRKFSIQIEMMNLLKQSNVISDVIINQMKITEVEHDGVFDVVIVKIDASINDQFISELSPELNRKENSRFTEYWSFIKKSNSENKDIYDSHNCPNCGADVLHVGEVCACEYCGVLFNSGQYDWVLCEITQSIDYTPRYQFSEPVYQNLQTLYKTYDDFSVNKLEDITSNAFMRILSAEALHQYDTLNSIISQDLKHKLEKSISKKSFLYDEFFTNEVTLIHAISSNTINRIDVRVTYTAKKVTLHSDKITSVSHNPVANTKIISLERSNVKSDNKGSIYLYKCPSCGATIDDITSIDCSYCGSKLASSDSDWIVTNIYSVNEYKSSGGKKALAYADGVKTGCLVLIVKLVLAIIIVVLGSVLSSKLADYVVGRKHTELQKTTAFEYGKYWATSEYYKKRFKSGEYQTYEDSIRAFNSEYLRFVEAIAALDSISESSGYYADARSYCVLAKDEIKNRNLEHWHDVYVALKGKEEAQHNLYELPSALEVYEEEQQNIQQLLLDSLQTQLPNKKRELYRILNSFMKDNHIEEGAVVFEVTLSKKGDVIGCTIKENDLDSAFVELAQEEVFGWHFSIESDKRWSFEFPFKVAFRKGSRGGQ